MPLIDLPVPKRRPEIEELAQTVGKTNEQLAYLLNGFLSSLNIKELTADKLTAGTILTAIITIMGALNGGGYIRIDDTGMTVNDGTAETFRIDLSGFVTQTGGVVRSSASAYPRLEFNSPGTAISAQDSPTSKLDIVSGNLSTLAPSIVYTLGSLVASMYLDNTQNRFDIQAPLSSILISAGLVLKLEGINVTVPTWSQFINAATSQNLQTALNSKANAFSGASGTVYVSSTSGGPATTAMTFSNGIRVS